MLTLSAPASAPGGGPGGLDVLVAVLGIVVVIAGAYYTTWLLARRTGRMQQGRAVQVLDRFAVGKDQMFCLLAMGENLYLVGMSGGGVTVVDKVTGEAARELRQACARPEEGLVARGAGFLAARARGRRFDQALDQARRSMGQARAAGPGPEEEDDRAAKLDFAREEDDIDAMLRQIAARKSTKRRGGPDGGDVP